MRTVHLVSNAHIDPCWLWEWEEGAAEAISTFRAAADFCEEYDNYIFCHNEVTLYRWVEEYEPPLFVRIQQLVAQGKWHIMGGWYLQPDCNMPSGESFVRQCLHGRLYFREKFGVTPRTAINFDRFGHSRGLVQILKKAGYDSYLFCRPGQNDCPLPDDDFTWIGFDGSQIIGHRSSEFYGSGLGKARHKVEEWMENHRKKPVTLILWGVGNHGGGPSRRDLNDLAALMNESPDAQIMHSTPEAFFDQIRASDLPLPQHEDDINPWGPGCYTSQIRIKQRHRLLENTLFMTEKMCSSAAIQGLMPYPRAELIEATYDLLNAEFHDILPGSSIQPVEEAGLRLMDHGLELLSRVRARAFFALASGQPRMQDERIPLLVYNPHPFTVRTVVECEFQLPDANWEEQFTVPTVTRNGQAIPSQNEQELSNINLDWRKRAVFLAELAPAQMNRFDCTFEVLPERPSPQIEQRDGKYELHTDDLRVVVNAGTGLVDRFEAGGVNYLQEGSFSLLVLDDNDDPWETRYQSFQNLAGAFKLMSPADGTRFSGVRQGTLDSVRVVEDGAVRMVIEALFEFSNSFAVVRYLLPKQGAEVEVQVRVYWNEKSRMLKLSLPTTLRNPQYLGQTAFGVQALPTNGREAVSQKWSAVVDTANDCALTVIDDGVYGSDFKDAELRLSLLRSAAYSGHPIHDRPIVPQDRHTPRIDQGERFFRFWINMGSRDSRLQAIDREALVHNERPFALSFCPSGAGDKPAPGPMLSDEAVQIVAFKQAENGIDYVIRLFEPTGRPRKTTLTIPILGIEETLSLGAFEVKSLMVETESNRLREINLIED